MKRILMLLDQVFPPDNRVEKEALSLIEAGFEVHILCISEHSSNEPITYNSINIHYLKYKLTWQRKLSAAYLVLPFHYLKWINATKALMERYNFDFLHIHDLPLSNVGTKLKRKYNFKLICDQHEYFSNWIGHTAHYNTKVGKIVKWLSNWKKYEKKHLSQADLVITIEEPLRQCYINEVGLNSNNIICVPNTPEKKLFNKDNVNQDIIDMYENHFVIFYAGVIDILRGINIVIESLPELSKTIPNIKFLLAGRLAKGCDPIADARKLGVEKFVEFVGWLNIDLLPSYIAASDICNHTPYIDSDEVNKTVATKIYQYILMGKPIIVSQAKMMKDIVVNNKVGFAIDGHDPSSYIKAVLEIYNGSKYVEEIQYNADQIKSFYTWENTIKNMLNKYRGFYV